QRADFANGLSLWLTVENSEQTVRLGPIGGALGEGGVRKQAGLGLVGVEGEAGRLGRGTREGVEDQPGGLVGQATPPWLAGQQDVARAAARRFRGAARPRRGVPARPRMLRRTARPLQAGNRPPSGAGKLRGLRPRLLFRPVLEPDGDL